MAKSSLLRARDLRDLFRLTGECRDLGDDAAAWRRHWLGSLARLVGAELACGGESARVNHRVQVTAGFEWGWENGFDRATFLRLFPQIKDDISVVELHQAYFAHPITAALGGTGLSRTDLVADQNWYPSKQYATLYEPIGVDHVLCCFQPAPGLPGVWNSITLNRPKGVKLDFSQRHRRIVGESCAQVTPLLGRALARHVAPSPFELAPRVRQVLRCLLEGDGDKQVARRLGISPYTVNQYTKVLYRHFHVASRAELLALWIRRGYPKGFSWASE